MCSSLIYFSTVSESLYHLIGMHRYIPQTEYYFHCLLDFHKHLLSQMQVQTVCCLQYCLITFHNMHRSLELIRFLLFYRSCRQSRSLILFLSCVLVHIVFLQQLHFCFLLSTFIQINFIDFFTILKDS